jgi:hypothetical protein
MKKMRSEFLRCVQTAAMVFFMAVLVASCGGGSQTGDQETAVEQVINAKLNAPQDRLQALQLAERYEEFLKNPPANRQAALQMYADLMCSSAARRDSAKQTLSGKEILNLIAQSSEDRLKMRKAIAMAGSFTSEEVPACK